MNLLHLYQPPTQDLAVTKRIAQESYLPLSRGLLKTPQAKIVFNISGSLTQQLVRLGLTEFFDNIKLALSQGRIELTASAAYHPILPLLSLNLVKRQIKLNDRINNRYFGLPRRQAGLPARQGGFFPPEMAWRPGLASLLQSLGFHYVFLDEISLSPSQPSQPSQPSSLCFFFRSRQASNFLALTKSRRPAYILKKLKSYTQGPTLPKLPKPILFTALDGETFGHHQKGFDQTLFQLYEKAEKSGLKPVLPGQLPPCLLSSKQVQTRSASWSSSAAELAQGIPYPLWQNPSNKIHQLQWQLTRLAIKTVRQHPQSQQPRRQLDAALHSDQFWWASKARFGKRIFWSPEFILKGAQMLARVVVLASQKDKVLAQKAKKIYHQIKCVSYSPLRKRPR